MPATPNPRDTKSLRRSATGRGFTGNQPTAPSIDTTTCPSTHASVEHQTTRSPQELTRNRVEIATDTIASRNSGPPTAGRQSVPVKSGDVLHGENRSLVGSPPSSESPIKTNSVVHEGLPACQEQKEKLACPQTILPVDTSKKVAASTHGPKLEAGKLGLPGGTTGASKAQADVHGALTQVAHNEKKPDAAEGDRSHDEHVSQSVESFSSTAVVTSGPAPPTEPAHTSQKPHSSPLTGSNQVSRASQPPVTLQPEQEGSQKVVDEDTTPSSIPVTKQKGRPAEVAPAPTPLTDLQRIPGASKSTQGLQTATPMTGLHLSAQPSPRAAVSSATSDEEDDSSTTGSVSTATSVRGFDIDHVQLQSQVKNLLVDLDHVKCKGDKTEQRIVTLEQEVRERLEKLEKGVAKVNRLEETLERVERLHVHFNAIQSFESRLAARVEELEKGLQRVTDVVFAPNVASGHTPTTPIRLGPPQNPADESMNGGKLASQPGPVKADPTKEESSDVLGPNRTPPGPQHPDSASGGREPKGPEIACPPSEDGVVLEGTGGNLEIADGTIEQLFIALEGNILSVVQTHFKRNIDKAAAKSIAREYWVTAFPESDWDSPSPNSPRSEWFRGLVANLIHAELFAKPFFGCDDEAIEGGLAAFEKLITGAADSGADEAYKDDTATWRALTARIMCRIFGERPKGGKKPEAHRRLMDRITTVFSTVLQPSTKATTKQLSQLCSKAIECAFAVRKSKDSYLWLQRTQSYQCRGADIVSCKRLRGSGDVVEDGTYDVVFTVHGAIVKDEVEVEDDDGRVSKKRVSLGKAVVVIA
ncbi:hypothetical protein QBC47DRAFT_366889 [Echria macrotheca]|uniref:Uncharacterized protein n=1 Tax=Echria macrotheca TaxID=438768 RepID=A0AAJ0FEF9_9PEZI|nr:hypothetical protein QBC47DRAFT_366889 [Echria macrotheca]